MSDDTRAHEIYDQARLNVEVSGPEEGAPVVMLHGWGSSAKLMRPLAKSMEHRWRVFNVDLPGHGPSPPPTAPWGVPEHANLVHQVIKERVLHPAPAGRRVTLLGHSNGGRIALYMASEPNIADCIERLILISPSGIKPKRSATVRFKSALAKTLKAPFQALPSSRVRDFGLDWLRHSLVWKALGSSDYRRVSGTMRDTFVKTVNHHLAPDRLGRIEAPTLIFWGEDDTAVSRRQVEQLENGIPDAGLVVLKEAGHYGYLDDPDTLMAGIQHFLSRE